MATRKSILNVSSRKKRDTMRPVSFPNWEAPGVQSRYEMNGSFGLTVLGWVATARDRSPVFPFIPGNQASVDNPTVRTAKTCYMRGLKENIEVQTSTGLTWQWRRVCFTFKGAEIFQPSGPSALGSTVMWNEDSSGYRRGLFSLTSSNAFAVRTWDNIQSQLFKGTLGQDYSNYLTAPLDRDLVTVKWDRTHVIRSGNNLGTMQRFKEWHPMNKNLIYDDDEVGGEESASNLSARGRRGMGDYYVIDIFVPGIGGTTSDGLTFDPEATLYWHER